MLTLEHFARALVLSCERALIDCCDCLGGLAAAGTAGYHLQSLSKQIVAVHAAEHGLPSADMLLAY